MQEKHYYKKYIFLLYSIKEEQRNSKIWQYWNWD